MMWSVVAAVLALGPTVHAYNPSVAEAWCASEPVPKEQGLVIPGNGGWRTFPGRPPWCSSGVVVETAAEHEAHGKRGPCPTTAAMWDVALRKAKQ